MVAMSESRRFGDSDIKVALRGGIPRILLKDLQSNEQIPEWFGEPKEFTFETESDQWTKKMSDSESITGRELDSRIEAIETRFESKVDLLTKDIEHHNQTLERIYSSLRDDNKETRSTISSTRNLLLGVSLTLLVAVLGGVSYMVKSVDEKASIRAEVFSDTATRLKDNQERLSASQDELKDAVERLTRAIESEKTNNLK